MAAAATLAGQQGVGGRCKSWGGEGGRRNGPEASASPHGTCGYLLSAVLFSRLHIAGGLTCSSPVQTPFPWWLLLPGSRLNTRWSPSAKAAESSSLSVQVDASPSLFHQTCWHFCRLFFASLSHWFQAPPWLRRQRLTPTAWRRVCVCALLPVLHASATPLTH